MFFFSFSRSKCSRVHRHVESFRLPWALVCSKWFVCAYADVLPVETTLRLWDCLFAEGSKVLLRAAVALVVDGDNQKKILGCSEFGALAAVFKSLTVGEQATRCHEFVTVSMDRFAWDALLQWRRTWGGVNWPKASQCVEVVILSSDTVKSYPTKRVALE